jgi:hypothetical protein
MMQDLEIGPDRGVHGLHDNVLDFAGPHPAQVDLARRVDLRQVAPNRHGDFGSRRCRAGNAKRGARHGELHDAYGYHRFSIAKLDHPTNSTTKCADLHKIADADFGVPGRFTSGRLLSRQPLKLAPLLTGKILDALSRLSRRFLALLRRRFQLADRPLDFGACFEKILPGLAS